MNPAVRIDPETGLKVFSTRAAKASEKIVGKGYSVLTNQQLKELPEMPADATFNAEEQAKYRAFKEARRGVIHDGVEYPPDVLIYATGFQCMGTSTFNMVPTAS